MVELVPIGVLTGNQYGTIPYQTAVYQNNKRERIRAGEEGERRWREERGRRGRGREGGLT